MPGRIQRELDEGNALLTVTLSPGRLRLVPVEPAEQPLHIVRVQRRSVRFVARDGRGRRGIGADGHR